MNADGGAGRVRAALKVGVSGVRGVIGEALTPQVAAAFAQAFGTFTGRGPVLVGRDTRSSGPMIEQAVTAGLQSVGCEPVRLGRVPTPSLLRHVPASGARGGIMITASHNAAPWNALKFADRHGLFLAPSLADDLFDLYHQQDFPLVGEAEIRAPRDDDAAVREHLDAVAAYVDAGAIRARRFRVAIDPVNGVGALSAAAFLCDRMGCEVVAVNDTPDGRFAREPEPLPEHLGALGEAVRGAGCDIGFAQDPDGDRLAIVDETGRPIGEDYTLALAVHQVLTVHGKGPVVVNLTASRVIERIAADAGCEVVRTRTGEIHVVQEMLARGAVVGGENIGGVILPAVHPCRDSYGAMAIVLELLASSSRTVRAWRQAWPRMSVARHKVPVRGPEAPAILREVRQRYADRPLNLLDGVWIDFGSGWAAVRRSNTEPIIRITAEAGTPEEAMRLGEEVRQVAEEARRRLEDEGTARSTRSGG